MIVEPSERRNQNSLTRLRAHFTGIVQGVGFRPTLYRLAKTLALTGWVQNTGVGVVAELEGPRASLESWIEIVLHQIPLPARIDSSQAEWLDPIGFAQLEIRKSASHGPRAALVPPDIATCPDCLTDMSNPKDRRYQYPFTTCTQCGPRYSLIENIPFDRPVTTMNDFTMCEDCHNEYLDPSNRRFHSQTNCCPSCGPTLTLMDPIGNHLASANGVWGLIQKALEDGHILALKGVGGFQLVCSATNSAAVARLRERKQRPAKPFAVMFANIEAAKKSCLINAETEHLLTSQAAPIVLVEKRVQDQEANTSKISDLVAPSIHRLGIMLPASGLHYQLSELVSFPLILTSGNVSGEPICIEDVSALKKLGQIAELFLVHNRRIARAVDDSVVHLIQKKAQILRRARGYAPLPISLPQFFSTEVPSASVDLEKRPILALGGNMKNSIALGIGDQAIVSQHLGDLENHETFLAFVKTCEDFQHIYAVEKPEIVCDLHPDYQSTHFADQINSCEKNVFRVQHHWSHALAVAAEHQVQFPFLAIVWDGTGYGTDGTAWGGEFIQGHINGFKRVGNFRPFRLPGGEQASRQPQRSLAGLLYELMQEQAPIESIYKSMLRQQINSPQTSSVGRLFDAVAALLGLCDGSNSVLTFEGEAAIKLQTLAEASNLNIDSVLHYPILMKDSILDSGPMILEMLTELKNGVNKEIISLKFHSSLARVATAVALSQEEKRIILTGGCFQNQLLLNNVIQELQKNGFVVYWPQQIPPNDGGVSLGQIMAAHLKNT